jgi:3-methyladenine DNA glycosylase AlkD
MTRKSQPSHASRLLQNVRTALLAVADPRKAPIMQAYMKSTMPYHGVPTQLIRQVCREQFAHLEFAMRKAIGWALRQHAKRI